MGGLQRAIVQNAQTQEGGVPLKVCDSVPIPKISSPHHVLVRVLTVGLNPTDYKMATRFPMKNNVAGCDFCGTVEQAGISALFSTGTRVCGAVFPYRRNNRDNGAFAQWVVADSRHLLRVPEDWTDIHAAALGGVGWSTVCLAMSDPDALALECRPGDSMNKSIPVIVYGGATATGLIATQILKLSGYAPIAVCSSASASTAMEYGAAHTADYMSSKCAEDILAAAGGIPIRHSLDCITDRKSSSVCFKALARTGGRYACLEEIPDSWRTRRAIKVKVVMGYEIQGEDTDFGHEVYTRKAKPEWHALGVEWAGRMQGVLDAGKLIRPSVREIGGGFEGVVAGLRMLQTGDVRGGKVVVRL